MYDGLLYIVYSGNKRYYTKLYGSSRFIDPPNRSTCKIDKTRTDPPGSRLTEPNSGFFFFRKSDEATVSSNCLVCLNGSYVYIYILRQSINGDDYLLGAARTDTIFLKRVQII